MLGAAGTALLPFLMQTGQAPYDSDFTSFMTGEAGPSDWAGGSRFPFSCCLEEHVLYSEVDESFDPCHVPLFPATNWTRKEVRPFDWGKGPEDGADPVDRLTGWNGTD